MDRSPDVETQAVFTLRRANHQLRLRADWKKFLGDADSLPGLDWLGRFPTQISGGRRGRREYPYTSVSPFHRLRPSRNQS